MRHLNQMMKNYAPETSAQPCGCDSGAQHKCLWHTEHVKAEETRVVDPKTGGEKGSKITRFSLIPREFLWSLATHYGLGARKYDDRNWERGYKWSLTQDALERHLNSFLLGERHDPETGTHHLVCAAWHIIAMYIFDVRGLGTNDITKDLK